MENHNERIIRWSSQEGGNEYIAINKLLQYLGDNLYYDYEPSFGPFPDYYTRLKKWVNNLTEEEDQQTLLKLAQNIFYVGHEEFSSLYRSAFNTQIVRWLIEHENLSFTDPKVITKIKKAIGECWFCPVTDSLRINQFYHINQIKDVNHEYRPDWKSLRKFGDLEKIKAYIQKNKIKYLVLLEDFVGSATQSWKPIKFASELMAELKILFVPLIICPLGIAKIEDEMDNAKNFYMRPVLTLSNEGFVSEKQAIDEKPEIDKFRRLINKVEPFYKFKEEEFKFGFENMGCLLVMHTNTPTNSLPIIYYESADNWSPLFKRHHRAKLWM